MDLGLSEIQKMLQESSRDYLLENCTMDYIRAMESDQIGISDEIWKNMADMGWLGLMIPEIYGGSGFNFDDMSILLEEMGKVALSGPFFSTSVIGAQTLLLSGDESQKKEFLPKIASGNLKFSLAFNEKTGSFEESEVSNTTSIKNDEGWTLNGEKYFVTDKACQGLGEGEMSAEQLKVQRDAAKADHEARIESNTLVPLLYSIIMGDLVDQSKTNLLHNFLQCPHTT